MGQKNAPIIILLRPQLPENGGAVARAMGNFGLKSLRLCWIVKLVGQQSFRFQFIHLFGIISLWFRYSPLIDFKQTGGLRRQSHQKFKELLY